MKNKEEPSAHSMRGNPSVQVDLHFADDAGTETTGSLSRPGSTATARAEKPALSDSTESLMELIVDDANIEAAWKNVKRNRGAPGPDGETIGEFFESFRTRWPEVRQQLLDGTYEPSPVRRKAIDKEDGGQRLLGIPNVQERLIQQAIVLILYFGLASQLKLFARLDQWIRRRIRCCYWKQWRRPKTRRRNLIRLGVPRRQAIRHARSRKGPWHMAKTIASGVGMTNKWLQAQGVLSLKTLWAELAPLR